VMDWRNKVADGFVTLGVTQPAEMNKKFAYFLISGLILLIALGGLAM
jgi:hypothetical protein